MFSFKKGISLRLQQPIDRTALSLILVLNILIVILLWSGDHSSVYVRDFSWKNQQVGAEDNAFTFTFSRPMNHASVEANLHISPSLPGKFSWAGRRMSYTLNSPAHYETTYKIELNKALDKFTIAEQNQKTIQPFISEFHTHDRAFVYIGIEGEEKGRLILYNLTHKQKTILTPKDLVVLDFQPYPDGTKILFSATEWLSYRPGLAEQQLYTVTTSSAGKIDLVIDSNDYQNLKFDLSPDGQVIVVHRVNRNDTKDSGLWVFRKDLPPQPLKNQQGGEFLIAPDSDSLAIALVDGIAIVPLIPSPKPLDFLPKFGKILSFSKDGVKAAMVKFNSDFTQSLFLVNIQGIQRELLHNSGKLLKCQFDPPADHLYCFITQMVLQGKEYNEQPYLVTIDLKTSQITKLLLHSNQIDTQISLSPDGVVLLIDQVSSTGKLPQDGDLTTDLGTAISTSHLLLLPISPTHSQLQPRQLPLLGLQPKWLP